MNKIRQKAYDILEAQNRLGRYINIFIMAIIVLNFVSIILETHEDIAREYEHSLFLFELVSIGIFTVEYILRVWSCTAADEYSHPVFGRLKYARNFFSVIDLLAILPFYLSVLIPGVDLRALRLFRLLRIFKLMRHFEAAMILPTVIYNKRQELILATAAVFILLLISSSFIYFAEHDAQPEIFSSISASMWWAITTLSTVGYGDMTPITPLGRLLGGFISILGIGMFALPAGVLAQGFDEAMKEVRKTGKVPGTGRKARKVLPERCPSCGAPLEITEKKL
ncbi:MAG TPA: ion transporter [Gammaproteobacteria bacterium]|nr:ion transporter [Gammaproteobacteria bacterium]